MTLDPMDGPTRTDGAVLAQPPAPCAGRGWSVIGGMLVTTALFATGCATEARSLANQAPPDAVSYSSVEAPAASPSAASSTVYSPAAQQYLMLVTALDAVGTAGWKQLTLEISGKDYAAVINDEIAATQRFDAGLEQYSWPPGAAADVMSLSAAARDVIVDDETIARFTATEVHPDADAIDATVGKAEKRLLACNAAVRNDLGLPPAATPGALATR
jgi:hypothetical protein